MVGEGDQAFVAAAVVPIQAACRKVGAQAFVEDAFQIAFHVTGVILLAGLRAVEEGGRRKLLRISDHDDLPAACHRADRVPHRDLRGLVEHHDVERRSLGGQELCD